MSLFYSLQVRVIKKLSLKFFYLVTDHLKGRVAFIFVKQTNQPIICFNVCYLTGQQNILFCPFSGNDIVFYLSGTYSITCFSESAFFLFGINVNMKINKLFLKLNF